MSKSDGDSTHEMLAHIVASIGEIQQQMATRDSVHASLVELVPGLVALELKPLHHELRSVNRRLEHLDAQIGHVQGFAVEIDALQARVAEIERHLGIDRKIAA